MSTQIYGRIPNNNNNLKWRGTSIVEWHMVASLHKRIHFVSVNIEITDLTNEMFTCVLNNGKKMIFFSLGSVYLNFNISENVVYR